MPGNDPLARIYSRQIQDPLRITDSITVLILQEIYATSYSLVMMHSLENTPAAQLCFKKLRLISLLKT